MWSKREESGRQLKFIVGLQHWTGTPISYSPLSIGMFCLVVHNINHVTKRPTLSPDIDLGGAYYLTENFGNPGWKVNGKVTFGNSTENWGVRFEVVRSIRLVRTKRMLLTIYQFLGSFSVPDSRYRNSPLFWSQSRMWQFCNKLVNRLLLCFLSGLFCQMVSILWWSRNLDSVW